MVTTALKGTRRDKRLKNFIVHISMVERYKYVDAMKCGCLLKIRQQADSFESLKDKILENKDKFFEYKGMDPAYSEIRWIRDKSNPKPLPSYWDIMNA